MAEFFGTKFIALRLASNKFQDCKNLKRNWLHFANLNQECSMYNVCIMFGQTSPYGLWEEKISICTT